MININKKEDLCVFMLEACVVYLSARRTLVLFVHSLEDFEELLSLFLVDFELLHEGDPLIILHNALGVSRIRISGAHGIHFWTIANHTQEKEN